MFDNPDSDLSEVKPITSSKDDNLSAVNAILLNIVKNIGIGILKVLILILGSILIFLIGVLLCLAFVWVFTGFGIFLLGCPDVNLFWKILIIIADLVVLYFIGARKE